MERAKSLGLDLLLLVFLVGTVWALFDPQLAFQKTHVAGGDTVSHPWIAKSLKQAWSHGDLWSWNHGWFAGFPLFYFYFPLPSLVIVVLDVFLPYGVAFKLVTVVGLLATPPAVYFMTRAFRFSRSVSAIAGSAIASQTDPSSNSASPTRLMKRRSRSVKLNSWVRR